MNPIALALSAIAAISITGALMVMGYDAGREQERQVLLRSCQSNKAIVINGSALNCGVIQQVKGLEAAKYRRVKNCVIELKRWEDEKAK